MVVFVLLQGIIGGEGDGLGCEDGVGGMDNMMRMMMMQGLSSFTGGYPSSTATSGTFSLKKPPPPLTTPVGQHRNSNMHMTCNNLSTPAGAEGVSKQLLSSSTLTPLELRPFSCSFCQKRFKRKDHLRDHERLHTGERPYTCPYCGKSFVQRCNWNIHRFKCGNNPANNIPG